MDIYIRQWVDILPVLPSCLVNNTYVYPYSLPYTLVKKVLLMLYEYVETQLRSSHINNMRIPNKFFTQHVSTDKVNTATNIPHAFQKIKF